MFQHPTPYRRPGVIWPATRSLSHPIKARCHSAAGLFVLITIQEVPYERHDQKAEESENDDLGSTR